MSNAPAPQQAMFSQIDVGNLAPPPSKAVPQNREEQRHCEMMASLTEIVKLQKIQNTLLSQLINIQTAAQRQRMADLQKWREKHPELSQNCRTMLDRMSEMQTEYFTRMVETCANESEDWDYGEFMFNDFVDKFGPRLNHLNGILQALSQLAAPIIQEAPQKVEKGGSSS